MSEYSLRKSKKILVHLYKGIKRKRTPKDNKEIIGVLEALQDAVLEGNQSSAHALAKKAQDLYKQLPKRSAAFRLSFFILGLGLALFVAVLIRQSWFELYEIPTGSMRPTFKEKDRVLVSKCKFGINIPLMTKHLYFDRDSCKRMSIIVFTSENLNTHDTNMLYFYLFPGKKQFVKRLIGKPGDQLYFYGGKIYGIDKNGQDISEELQQFSCSGLEHIPFIRFEGTKYSSQTSSCFYINQMGENLAKISKTPLGRVESEFLDSKIGQPKGSEQDLYDLWGIKNFAIARLVPIHLVDPIERNYINKTSPYSFAIELHHSPSISQGKLFGIPLKKEVSYIPLTELHMKRIFQSLYTARFVVKNGAVHRYGSNQNSSNLTLSGIKNGTYEFYNGIAYQIYPTGVSRKLPPSHPLYNFSSERLLFFFNLGIELNSHYIPTGKNDIALPSRYAYFRDGSLFLQGVPIVLNQDLELVRYQEIEYKKTQLINGYHPFIDFGPPMNLSHIK